MEEALDAHELACRILEAVEQAAEDFQPAETDAALRKQVSELGKLVAPPTVRKLEAAPPRAVAVAMAKALFSLPHVARTLAVATTLSDVHAFVVNPGLARALGLPMWELEDIRDHVDEQAALQFKRMRAMNWLWYRFSKTDDGLTQMWQALFPGLSHIQPVAMEREGSRIYLVVPQPRPPAAESLYLRFHPQRASWSIEPDGLFRAEWMDPALLGGIARSVGAERDELILMLDQMITVVPQAQGEAFKARDRWRSEGWAELTGLGRSTPSTGWVTWRIPSDGIDLGEGLLPDPQGKVSATTLQVLFDRHAAGRVTAVLHGIYAEFMARLLSAEVAGPMPTSALFDLRTYVSQALAPLLDWTRSEDTHRWLARQLGLGTADAADYLSKVGRIWHQRMNRVWLNPEPGGLLSLLTGHLAALGTSATKLWYLTPDQRSAHHRCLLLFLAHYLQTARVDRLWAGDDPVDDVASRWFWGTWQRVLDSQDVVF